MSFPTVKLDATHWLKGTQEQRLAFAQQLAGGLRDHGFVVLKNHGVSSDFVGEIFRQEDQFFNKLPRDQKMACAREKTGLDPGRGFNWHGREKSWKRSPAFKDDPEAKDSRESFEFGPLDAKKWPNQWPTEEQCPGFREASEQFYHDLWAVTKYVLQAMELGFGFPEGTISSRTEPTAADVRFNHYPGISVKELENPHTQRIFPHIDVGILTLLFQDAQGGLAYRHRESGKMLPVNSEDPADLTVTTAECLERMSNGVLKAAWHQVGPPNAKPNKDGLLPSRFSAGFFYRCPYEQSIAPIPEFVKLQPPAKFGDITAADIMFHKNAQVHPTDVPEYEKMTENSKVDQSVLVS